MQPNDIPKPSLPLKGGPVSLNQPFPEELKNVPVGETAEQVGQAAVENSVKKVQAKKINEETVQAIGTLIQTAGSIAAESAVVKSAIKSPATDNHKSKSQDSKKATSNPIVKTLVKTCVILVIIGLIALFFVNAFLGIMLMFLGSAAIIACVFLPIGVAKK